MARSRKKRPSVWHRHGVHGQMQKKRNIEMAWVDKKPSGCHLQSDLRGTRGQNHLLKYSLLSESTRLRHGRFLNPMERWCQEREDNQGLQRENPIDVNQQRVLGSIISFVRASGADIIASAKQGFVWGPVRMFPHLMPVPPTGMHLTRWRRFQLFFEQWILLHTTTVICYLWKSKTTYFLVPIYQQLTN